MDIDDKTATRNWHNQINRRKIKTAHKATQNKRKIKRLAVSKQMTTRISEMMLKRRRLIQKRPFLCATKDTALHSVHNALRRCKFYTP